MNLNSSICLSNLLHLKFKYWNADVLLLQYGFKFFQKLLKDKYYVFFAL